MVFSTRFDAFHAGRQGKRLEEEPEKELEPLDVFGVEDVTDVKGEPLFQGFTFEACG